LRLKTFIIVSLISLIIFILVAFAILPMLSLKGYYLFLSSINLEGLR